MANNFSGFTDRMEFSSGFGVADLDLEGLRTELQADIDAFLKAGGQVEALSYDPTDEVLAKVGVWEEMGYSNLMPSEDSEEDSEE